MQDLLKLQNGSDIRGVAIEGVSGEPVNLTQGAVNRIASGFAQLLSKKLGKPVDNLKISVGHDSRITASRLLHAICESLTVQGVNVLNCGLTSTPAMFMSTIFNETKADGAIMLTASHLPFNRNGMKFFTAQGGLDKPDITAILELAAKFNELNCEVSSAKSFSLIDLYARHLREKICVALQSERPFVGMRIIVDAGNGIT